MRNRLDEGPWSRGQHLVLVGMIAALIANVTTTARGEPASCTNALNTTAEIQSAMKDAAPGAIILIAPGVYVGNRSTSGDPDSKGLFYSGRSGTSSSPIVMMSCDPNSPALLSGVAVDDGSYGVHLTGDHWQIRDLIVTQVQKGIVIDNGNQNLLSGLEVHRIGDEGVHSRDGSSYNTLERSKIHDTGNGQPGYGEGAYVGSDASASYDHAVIGNAIRSTEFAGNITAEHIDIKEGADGTVVENCTFDGTGISGANSADSFVDVKGVNSIVRYNQGSRNRNAAVVDAFQVRTHGTGYATGVNNSFHDNTVDLDNVPGYVVYATSATTGTTAHDDVRTGGGNLYSGNVTVLPSVGVADPLPPPSLAVSVVPDPAGNGVDFHCDIDHADLGTVSVFDVTGRRVVQIARAPLSSGRHVFHWDGRVAQGLRAGRGVYFVRVMLDRREAVRRFALMR